MSQSLVAFDTDRIKDYVFATRTLKEIRGASRILDTLNRKTLPDVVGGTCYYAHGGSGLFQVPADDAEPCIERVRRVYTETTGGAASITGASLSLPDNFDEDKDDIRELWKHLGYKLRAAKDRNPSFLTSNSHPLLRPGNADGTFYATHLDEEQEPISSASFLKRQTNTKIRNESRRNGQPLPEDFDNIANALPPEGYFALIYADGDGLGQALDSCKTLPELQALAKSIDDILRQAKEDAVARQQLHSEQYDTLLHGGDDLILAVPARAALDITIYLMEEFTRQATQLLGQSYTLSSAIVWAHTSFPFGTWLDITDGALKFAKREKALRERSGLDSGKASGGLINFLAISSANHSDFKQYYDDVLSSGDIGRGKLFRTLRPYTIPDLKRLMAYRQRLTRMPRSKLEGLRQAIFQPRSRAMYEALRSLVHWRDETSRAVIQEMLLDLVESATGKPGQYLFPFIGVEDLTADPDERLTNYHTPLVDLAEIWDFIPGDVHAN